MKRLTRATLSSLGLGFALAFTAGCAATPVDQHWGEAHRTNALAQTVNPDAGRTGPGPEGLDPRTAELVTETYERNQRKERSDPEEIFLLRQ